VPTIVAVKPAQVSPDDPVVCVPVAGGADELEPGAAVVVGELPGGRVVTVGEAGDVVEVAGPAVPGDESVDELAGSPRSVDLSSSPAFDGSSPGCAPPWTPSSSGATMPVLVSTVLAVTAGPAGPGAVVRWPGNVARK
jgi:hypothetical protein